MAYRNVRKVTDLVKALGLVAVLMAIGCGGDAFAPPDDPRGIYELVEVNGSRDFPIHLGSRPYTPAPDFQHRWLLEGSYLEIDNVAYTLSVRERSRFSGGFRDGEEATHYWEMCSGDRDCVWNYLPPELLLGGGKEGELHFGEVVLLSARFVTEGIQAVGRFGLGYDSDLIETDAELLFVRVDAPPEVD